MTRNASLFSILILLNIFVYGMIMNRSVEASCSTSGYYHWRPNTTVTYDVTLLDTPTPTTTSIMQESARAALATWNEYNFWNCSDVSFSESSSAKLILYSFTNPSAPQATATVITFDSQGYRASTTIKFNLAWPCNYTKNSFGSFVYRILLHEIGHTMGLHHPNVDVRGQSVMNAQSNCPPQYVTTNDTYHWLPDDVQPCDNWNVRFNYVTQCAPDPISHEPPLTICVQVQQTDSPTSVPSTCDSPILFDLGNGGVLTDWVEGVHFDVGVDGIREKTAWTPANSQDAWLALDRNGNGKIDNGLELFGNVTPQPDTPHPNGYLALAVYDQAANGGNEDGVITNADAVWPLLRLWVDGNHNGASESAELFTLDAKGVSAIGLRYHSKPREDAHHNLYHYTSRAMVHGRILPTWDVFLISASTTASNRPDFHRKEATGKRTGTTRLAAK